MKTLDEILENVTAGGRWDQNATYVYAAGLDGANVCACGEPRSGTMVGYTPVSVTSNDLKEAYANAEYIVRSARSFPTLVRAMDLMIYAPDSAEAMRVARSAMAEALKD